MASGVVGIQRISKGKLRDARDLRKNMTNAEALLWEQLRGRQCGGLKFRRQQIIEGFVADFYCEQANIVIEVDGTIHDKSDVKLNDIHRENVFKARGIITVRFSNDDVEQQTKSVIDKIKEICKSRVRPTKLTLWEVKRRNRYYLSPLASGEGPGVRSK